MDLAVYISELLGLQGEVNVPGMGGFAQIRINGYFDEQEKKFYPPVHQVVFKPQSNDSDELAVYIAGKKNISLASAKYFIEKYVTGTKHEAETKEVVIDGLGYLYTNDSVLAFKGDIKKANDPSFFGLPPVNAFQSVEKPVSAYTLPVEKLNEELPVAKESPVKEVHQEVINNDTIIESKEQEEEYQEEYDDGQQGRRINTGIILLMFLIIVILGVTGLYIYRPSVIEKFIDAIHAVPAKRAPLVTAPPASKKDTAKTISKTPDTIAKTTIQTTTAQVPQANVIDSTKSRFEIMAGSFKTQKAADLAIKNYQSLGVDAKIVTDAPGKRIKLSIGTFTTKEEAEAARIELIKTKKVSKDIYPLEIKAKK